MRQRQSLAISSFLLFAGVLGTKFVLAGTIPKGPDAVSGASIAILGGNTTDTTATISWKMNNQGTRNGTMVWNLNTVNNGTTSKKVGIPASVRQNEATSATYTITGSLIPATKYYFWLYCSEGNYSAKSVTDSFTTEKTTTSIQQKNQMVIPMAYNSVDPLGRRLQNQGAIQLSQFGSKIDLNAGHR